MTTITAPLDSSGFVLALVSLDFWKNYLVRIAFGATVDSSGYESVSMDSQKICNDSGFVLLAVTVTPSITTAIHLDTSRYKTLTQ